jgi:hypothetical protein
MIRMGEAQAKVAGSEIRKRIREDARDKRLESEHIPMNDMKCDWGSLTQADPIALLHAKPQQGQCGWWIPEINTKVTAFWGERDGGASLGGTPGEWHHGKVTAVAWEEDSLPHCEVTYPCGHKEWHNTRWAGTALRLLDPQGKSAGGRLMLTDTMPEPVASLMGPGTRIMVRWQTQSVTYKWWQGRVVANDGDRVAVFYEAQGKENRQVVWHTDLHQRGCRIKELVRMREGANEDYQTRTQLRARECVLLTDDGECECAWCCTEGWPSEVDAMEKMGMDEDEAWDLRNMGPREGRAASAKRKPEPLPAEPQIENPGENGDGQGSNEAADGRDMRAKRRGTLRDTGGPCASNKDPEIPAPDRHRPASGQNTRVASRGGRRGKGTTGRRRKRRMDVSPGTGTGEVEMGDPGPALPIQSAEPEIQAGAPRSGGISIDMGSGERGAPDERNADSAKEGKEGTTEDGEAQDVEDSGARITQCGDPGAGPHGASVPRGRPGGPQMDLGGGSMDLAEALEHPKRRRHDDHSGGTPARDAVQRKLQRRTQGVGHCPGSRGRLGIDRNGSDGGGVCNCGSGQRGSPLPGQPPWAHQIQGPDGFLGASTNELATEDRQEGRDRADRSDGRVAVAGVHTPLEGKQHEHIEGVCPRTLCGVPSEHTGCDTRETTIGEGEICEVQAGSGGAAPGTGGGGHPVRNREPTGEPLLGTGVSNIQGGQTRNQRLEDPPGRPVCIREASTEAHTDPNERHLDTNGPDWDREMQNRAMLRDIGEQSGGARSEAAQAANSSQYRRKEDESRRNPKRGEGHVLGGGSEKQGGDHVGTRAPVGSKTAGNTQEVSEQEEQGGTRGGSKRRKTAGGTWVATIGKQGRNREQQDRNRNEEELEDEPKKKRIRETRSTEREGIC